MGDPELTRILAELVKTQAVNRQPSFKQVSGLSQAILSGIGPQKPWDANAGNNAADVRGPSFVNRVLDIMSRPLYGMLEHAQGAYDRGKDDGVLGTLREGVNPEGLKDIWAGLSGKKKTTGRDIIADNNIGEDLSGFSKGLLGFGIDVLADPLTYTGAGLVPKLGKAAKVSTEALRAVEEGTGSTAKTLAEQISERATQQAGKLNEGSDLHVNQLPKDLQVPPELSLPNTPVKGASGGGFVKSAADEDLITDTRMPRNYVGEKPEIPIADTEKFTDDLFEEILPPRKSLEDSGIIRGSLDDIEKQYPGIKFTNEAVKTAKNPLEDLKVINQQIASTKSPVAKSILRKEAEKIQAGVKPADILSEARTAPPPFPPLSIGDRWIESAKQTAKVFMSQNRLKDINHVGQSNLYNSIVHSAIKVRRDRRQFAVFQMLRAAEDELLGAGRTLTDAEGISVRLSDVANTAGGPRALTPRLVDDFRKARPSQVVEDVKAYNAPATAARILDPVVNAGQKVAGMMKDLPPSRVKPMSTAISKELTSLARAAGASSKEAGTAKKFIDDLFNPARDPLYRPIQQEARSLVRQTTTGVVNPTSLHKITEATYEALGANPKVLGRLPIQTKVVEAMMTKFATWWGAKDLKPFSKEYIDTARNVAAAFAETITPLVRATKPTERATAWSIAAGKISAGSPQEQALANQFSYMVERLLGTHGVKEGAEAVLTRSGTVMKELNNELPKHMQFIDRKVVDDLGREFDYTKDDWMHSWKEWKAGEPAENLYQLTRALQLVTRKNSMWDDAAARWGMPLKTAEFQHVAQGIPRLAGTYFPQQIADQLNNLTRQLDRDVFKTPHKAIELFDKVQRMWKTGVTIYSPSHHIRNLNGDIYLAALDGVVSPKPYAIATKVLHAFPTRYKDMESVFNIMDPKLRDTALRARPGNVVLTTARGEKMTSEQLYQAAESQGLFTRAMNLEDLGADTSPALGTLGTKIQPFGGRVNAAASRVSELRDHWVRLAHFADVIGKSRQPLRVAVEQAGRRVRKFHPDGMDMTGFEQNVMRRIIPFYSWMRKATPLVIEGAIMRPHISLAFPKAMANMQLVTGIESQGPGDPFPMDQMFPDWIKEKGIGPILNPGSGLGRDENWRGDTPGYTIINPTNPLIDQLSQLGSPAKTLLSSLSPAARIPMELLQGQTSLGIPLENVEGGTPGYLAQQIPAVGIGMRLSGATRDNEPYNPEQVINWLTGAGVTGTGPYESQAQTEIRQILAQMAKNNRGDYR